MFIKILTLTLWVNKLLDRINENGYFFLKAESLKKNFLMRGSSFGGMGRSRQKKSSSDWLNYGQRKILIRLGLYPKCGHMNYQETAVGKFRSM